MIHKPVVRLTWSEVWGGVLCGGSRRITSIQDRLNKNKHTDVKSDWATDGLNRTLVYGTCYMWGTVIEHTLGYRAQHARVIGLELKNDGASDGWSYGAPTVHCDVDLDFLRKRYGVGA